MTRDSRSQFHGAAAPPRGGVGNAMLPELGRSLRSMYAGLMNEPLPEHLACILRKFEPDGGAAEAGRDDRAPTPRGT